MGLRIALVYRSFNLAGSLPRATVELARHLSKRHDVHIFSIAARTDPTLAPACTFHDVPVGTLSTGVNFSARELVTYARNVPGLIAREQFDVVHACAPSSWVGDVLHVPGVARGEAIGQGISGWRFHAGLVRRPGNMARFWIERRALRSQALRKLHAAAPSVCDDLVRYYGIPPERVLLVRPAVNLDLFHPDADRTQVRARLDVHDSATFVVLFCGSAFWRKGLDRAIQAVASTRARVELVVVGGGPETEFRQLAAKHGIADRVRFLGERSDVHLLYPAADAFVLPTRADIWGVTPIEAMASGVPPIVTAVAGSATAVEHDKTGIVLPEPFDVRDLREAIDTLAADPGRRNAMGAAGVAASRHHSWEARGWLVENDLAAIAEEKAAQTPAGRRQSRLSKSDRRFV